MTKPILLLLSILSLSLFSINSLPAQDYLWPIEGARAGADIISAPQSYIDGELNFANLFIGAKQGTGVLAPTDGIISVISLSYLNAMDYSSSMGCTGSFDEALENIRKTPSHGMNPTYISGMIGIKANDGNTIYISGLSGQRIFKTGQSVKRGELIGRSAYCYHKIKEPSICLSISKSTKPADPMSPFGIRSSFVAPSEIKPVLSLTKEQAKEDFTIYVNALKEAFPGLYDVITEEELDQYITRTITEIDAYPQDLKIADFRKIIHGAVATVHDSHIYLHPPQSAGPPSRRNYKYPSVIFGWFQDTLRCYNAVRGNEDLINKQILSINGMSADSMKKIVLPGIAGYDAAVESTKEFELARGNYSKILGEDMNIDVVFADGTRKKLNPTDSPSNFIVNMRQFVMTNRFNEGFATLILNDSTAYIGISTFTLNQMQVEKIGAFIDSISSVKANLIIDVRNNGGGDVEVLQKLYLYIAGDSLKINSYEMVNKQGAYECFKYSLNRVTDDMLFADFTAEEGKNGFYNRPAEGYTVVKADSSINYKGRVYVLTNESSTSAATLFPALLVRNHRGVVVGRETRSAYHFMNAIRFADIRLPNSAIVVTLPLVHCVFDTVVNDRAPYGRGVLPDYFVPLTVDEFAFTNGDAILNYTLKLIETGQYISPVNPFEADEKETRADKTFLMISLSAGLILAAALLFLCRRKKEAQS